MFNISVHDWDDNYYVPHNLEICTICRLRLMDIKAVN